MTLQLSTSEMVFLALEDVLTPAILYALLLPLLTRWSWSRHALCAGLAALALALLAGGCLPDSMNTPVLFVAASLVLGGLCITIYRIWRETNEETRETETVLFSVSVVAFLLSIFVGVFSLAVGVSPGSKPVVAAVLFIVVFRPLHRSWVNGHGRSITAAVLTAAVLLLLGRSLLWYVAFSSPESGSKGFNNLARLQAASIGLSHVQQDSLDKAVWSLHETLRGGNPEVIRSRVASWTGLDNSSLPILLAFGGEASLGRRNAAIAFAWDQTNRRIIVLGADGRLVAITKEGQQDLGEPLPGAIDLCVSSDGTRIGLVSGTGEVILLNESLEEQWKHTLPPESYRGIAPGDNSEEVLVVRADGATLRVSSDGVLLLSGYPTWPNERPAVAIASTQDSKGHYVLDRFGGVHPRGTTAIDYEDLQSHSQTDHFWPNRDLARSIVVSPHGEYPVYVDRYGGLHAVVKKQDRILYTGHRYPPLDDPKVVDLLVGAVDHMVHILTDNGTILPIPDKGWLLESTSDDSRNGAL